MSIEKKFDFTANTIYRGEDYLERPRLNALLKNAVNYPLVIVCAGSGYGKTYAVHSFLSKCDAKISWWQISERDNITSRFWESYVNMLSVNWPEANARLKNIGFPKSDDAFAKYSAVIRKLSCSHIKQIRVFDDFHLLHNPAVLRFFGRVTGLNLPNLTRIVISRTMPEVNPLSKVMEGQVFSILEDALYFTEEEISRYFNQIRLSVSSEDIRNVNYDTAGWAFAVNLIGRSLGKKGKYERHALNAMKKNIWRLIEAEISPMISAPLWRLLLRISLIDHFAAGLIRELAKEVAVNGDAIIKEMELLNAYIRYDYNLDSYMIHHLFLDYLRRKQEQLTGEEKKKTYQIAAKWCDANENHVDAFSYYEKSADYAAIISKISSYNVHIPPEMVKYMYNIIQNAPEEVKSTNLLYPAIYIRLKINLGLLDEAAEITGKYIKEYEARPETPERNNALAAIYSSQLYLRFNMCTYTDVYDFGKYAKKMNACFQKEPFEIKGSFKVAPTIAWASLVGTTRAEAMEEYIDALSRMIPYTIRLAKGFYAGFDDLARGELYYQRGELKNAEKYLKQSIKTAKAHNQYATQNRALVYLMEIAFFHGDLQAATAILEEMKVMPGEEDFGVRCTMYDIACGFYYLALEQTKLTPEWIKGDFLAFAHPSFIENYSNQVIELFHLQTRQYSSLLAFVRNAAEKQMPRGMILFDRIELKVMESLCLYHLKRTSEAVVALNEARCLAESNRIITPFTRHAKDMRTLTAAALKEIAKSNCATGDETFREWLETINHKSATYAKRKAKIISEYRLANNPGYDFSLTGREVDILNDLSDGLSRTEVAYSRGISVNTIKMAVNIIYEKLGAYSLPEAIHIAACKKII